MKTSERLRMALAITSLIGGGFFIAAWVVIWLMRGSYLSAIIALGAAALCFSLSFQMAYAASGRPQPRTEHGPGGTKIRPPKCSDLVFCLGLASGVLAAALYLNFAPFGMVDYVPSGVLRVALPAGCIFYVIFCAPILYRMSKHRGGSHLRLRPSGFEVWDGQWGTLVRGTWDEVEQILDHPTRRKKPFHEVTVFALPTGRNAMLVTHTITGNNAALRDWVRLYWQHPEYRVELNDGRGVRRLDEERFTTG